MPAYLRHDVTAPIEGIDKVTRPLKLGPELSPNQENTVLNADDIRQRPGMRQLGDAIFATQTTAADSPGDEEFPISTFTVDRLGTRDTVVFTRKQGFLFVFDNTVINDGTWAHITPVTAVAALNCTFQNGLTTVLCDADPTSLVARGDFIRSDSVSDRTQVYEVASRTTGPDEIILFNPWTPATTASGPISKQVFFTGGDDDPWSLASNTDTIYASQGSDILQKYDGTNEFTTVGGGAVPAKYLASFNRRLVLGHTFEGGGFQTVRILWSAIDNFEDFATVTSGFEDLAITSDPITGLLVGRNALAIYRENSIQTATNTGIVQAPFAFSHPTIGVGAVGRSMVNAQGVHLFMARDNVYTFDMFTPRPIGERIRTEIRTFNFNRQSQIFGHYSPSTREYQLFVPIGDDDFPTKAFVFYLPRQRWSKWDVPQLTGTPANTRGTLTAASDLLSQASDIWDTPSEASVPLDTDPTLQWDNESGQWDDIPEVDVPINIVGSTDGTMNIMDSPFTSDKGRNIEMVVETKDFDFRGIENVKPSDLKTLSRVRLLYDDLGTAFTLELAISTDGGNIFGSAQTKTVGGDVKRREVFFDTWVTAESFRLRFRKTTGNINPRYVEMGLQFIHRGKLKTATAS